MNNQSTLVVIYVHTVLKKMSETKILNENKYIKFKLQYKYCVGSY
jgi:hypothetical protein